VPAFTGRDTELAELDARLDTARRSRSGAGAVVVVAGTAGVGKTALAVHWAHRVADRADGRTLYIDLRGYDPDQPMSPGDALAVLLRDLGVRGADIPHELTDRVARYRTLLAGRRMLVILDNARDTEQVRLLLPGAGSSFVLVTSRDRLAGLVARYGAGRIELDLLSLAEAVELVRALLWDRAAAEPGAVTELADRCARLPLALRVAAELAAARPGTTLAALAAELASEHNRLDLLDAGGDPRTAVRAVFSWSYRHLPVEAARLVRLFGLHPGCDADVYALAALADSSADHTRRLVYQLVRAHLVQPTSPGRHGMHDLLRAYAAELAARADTGADRHAALTRLLDHYRHTAAAAVNTLFPASRNRRPHLTPSATAVPPVREPSQARAWLDTERATLTAVAVHAATQGWPEHAVDLSAILATYLDTGSHYTEALTIHTHALRAARQTGDGGGEAAALSRLGLVYWRWGRYPQAVDHLELALSSARRTGDSGLQARVLNNLGLVACQQGRYRQAAVHLEHAVAFAAAAGDPGGWAYALDNLGQACQHLGYYRQAHEHYQRALTILREIGDRVGEAAVRNDLGILYRRWGRLDEATDHHEVALALGRDTGHRVVEATALNNLGVLDQERGRLDQAYDRHQQALALYRETGYRADEADTLENLGVLYRRWGFFDQAVDHLEQALAHARETGYRLVETSALNSLGETLSAMGQPDPASASHRVALALAEESGDRYQQARSHDGIGRALNDAGKPRDARWHWQQALTRYTRLGVPEATRVRAELGTAALGAAVEAHADGPP
jgi:tetratricopeptide (TPR) repeat protein